MVIAQFPLNVKESERFRGAGPEEAAPDAPQMMAQEEVIVSNSAGRLKSA
jgi:hypothetical protein